MTIEELKEALTKIGYSPSTRTRGLSFAINDAKGNWTGIMVWNLGERSHLSLRGPSTGHFRTAEVNILLAPLRINDRRSAGCGPSLLSLYDPARPEGCPVVGLFYDATELKKSA